MQFIKAGPDLGQLTVFKKCSITQKEFSVVVDHQCWKEWQDGKLIQDALPSLTPAEREFLMSGLTPAEREEAFLEEESE
jgi:hypothetical protein